VSDPTGTQRPPQLQPTHNTQMFHGLSNSFTTLHCTLLTVVEKKFSRHGSIKHVRQLTAQEDEDAKGNRGQECMVKTSALHPAAAVWVWAR
jgi:hypothetical protein